MFCNLEMLKNCICNDESDTDVDISKSSFEEECRKRSKQIEKEIKRSRKVYKSTIKLLLLGTGESGKSTILKQMRIIHISKYTDQEKLEKINDIKSNIRDSILSILDAMERMSIPFENESLIEQREYVYENINSLLFADMTSSSSSHQSPSNSPNHDHYPIGEDRNKLITSAKKNPTSNGLNEFASKVEKLWDCIEQLWKDAGVKRCARRGNEYHLIDSAIYFLNRLNVIRAKNYLPDEQDILRCRVLTTGISETRFQVKNVNFHIFDVGGQRDQRRKWIQCFNQVTAIIYVVDISSFNMTLREDHRVNRLKESLHSFRQIWINRYLYHISIILFLNKYDLFVKKIVEENCKLEDYFPDYKYYEPQNPIDRCLNVHDEHREVTRAKMYILDQFIKITNEKLTDAMAIIAKHETNYSRTSNASNVRLNPITLYAQIENHPGAIQLNGDCACDDSTEKNFNPITATNHYQTSSDYEKKLQKQLKRSYREAKEISANGKFCIPYFTCAVDTENMKRVFKACSHILKKEHLEKCGLL